MTFAAVILSLIVIAGYYVGSETPQEAAHASQTQQPIQHAPVRIVDGRAAPVSLLNPPLIASEAVVPWRKENLNLRSITLLVRGNGPQIVYDDGRSFDVPTTIYAPSGPATLSSDPTVGTAVISSTPLSDVNASKAERIQISADQLHDINGDGWPEIVLNDYSGGAHCCTRLIIVSLRPDAPVCVFAQDLGSASADIQDIDGDGRREISTNVFAEYALGSFAFGTYGVPVIYSAGRDGVYSVNTRNFSNIIESRYAAAKTEYESRSFDTPEEQDSTLINLFFLGYMTGHRDEAFTFLRSLQPLDQNSDTPTEKLTQSLRMWAPEVLDEPEWQQIATSSTPSSQVPSDSTSSTDKSANTKIREVLDAWVASFRARDASRHASCYAAVVERYFLKTNVTRDQIERDKQAAFLRIASIRRYEITDVVIAAQLPDRYSATFRKSWDTPSANGIPFSGEEIQKLVFGKFDDGWKIVSEEEVQILDVVKGSIRRG